MADRQAGEWPLTKASISLADMSTTVGSESPQKIKFYDCGRDCTTVDTHACHDLNIGTITHTVREDSSSTMADEELDHLELRPQNMCDIH